jgi:hypothetical protein
VCIENDGQCHAICRANADCVSGCCAAVQGQTYGVCAPESDCATAAGIGDACSTSGQCGSGVCTGLWCSATCSVADSVCAGGHGAGGLYNAYGQLNWCLVNAGGADSCFAGCATTADCRPYPGTVCRTAYDVTGTSVSVCAQ